MKEKMTGVKFDTKNNVFVGLVDGRKVCQSQKEEKVVAKMRNLGFSIDSTSVEEKKEKIIFGINERFDFIEKFVRMVARGVSNSLIVAGPGGLGKTHTVTDTLQKMGKRELGIGDTEGDYIVVKGFSTAKALYRTLYENNGMTIIFDDTDAIMKDPIGANILKAALDSYDQRVISWNAEFSEREELPNRFEFVGRVIFITNMSLDKVPQALISRSLKCDVSMTIDEKIERIATVVMADNFMPSIDIEVKQDVIAFIRENANQFTDLNIRSAMNIAKIRYEMADEGWERMALYMAVA
jgi:hypothetical protein